MLSTVYGPEQVTGSNRSGDKGTTLLGNGWSQVEDIVRRILNSGCLDITTSLYVLCMTAAMYVNLYGPIVTRKRLFSHKKKF